MAVMHYIGAGGELVPVSSENPLPTAGGGAGGGMEPTDITADAPATATDNGDGTVTIGVSLGTTSTTAAAGNHTHAASAVTSGTFADARIPALATSKITGLDTALADLDRVGAAVADATDTTDVVTQLNALLASLRTAGLIAT